MNRSHEAYRPRRLYRDSECGVILGVCAGIAQCFEWPLWLTRLGALALAWLFPVTVVAVYLVAALVMPQRPLRYGGDGDERGFWQSRRHGS